MSNLANALYADSKGDFKQEILNKKIDIYLEDDFLKLKEAKKDLNKLMAINDKSSQIYYFKGRILLHEGFKK